MVNKTETEIAGELELDYDKYKDAMSEGEKKQHLEYCKRELDMLIILKNRFEEVCQRQRGTLDFSCFIYEQIKDLQEAIKIHEGK